MSTVINRFLAPESYQSREQRVSGITTATVGSLESQGMYRLKVHGMNGQPGDDHSAPARMMSPMASSGYGAYFFPEQGDEVVVAFLQGDPNHPVILGSVYNGTNTPPSQAQQSTNNNVRGIVSRSGHQILLDDTAGSQSVTIKTQGGHSIVFADSPTGPKITISSAGGRTVTIDDTPPGQISLMTPTCQITMAEPGVLSIQAATTLNISAQVINISGTSVSIASAAGTSLIDGQPFIAHTHLALPPLTTPLTGPVTPLP
jgi:hypothetical protein